MKKQDEYSLKTTYMLDCHGLPAEQSDAAQKYIQAARASSRSIAQAHDDLLNAQKSYGQIKTQFSAFMGNHDRIEQIKDAMLNPGFFQYKLHFLPVVPEKSIAQYELRVAHMEKQLDKKLAKFDKQPEAKPLLDHLSAGKRETTHQTYQAPELHMQTGRDMVVVTPEHSIKGVKAKTGNGSMILTASPVLNNPVTVMAAGRDSPSETSKPTIVPTVKDETAPSVSASANGIASAHVEPAVVETTKKQTDGVMQRLKRLFNRSSNPPASVQNETVVSGASAATVTDAGVPDHLATVVHTDPIAQPTPAAASPAAASPAAASPAAVHAEHAAQSSPVAQSDPVAQTTPATQISGASETHSGLGATNPVNDASAAAAHEIHDPSKPARPLEQEAGSLLERFKGSVSRNKWAAGGVAVAALAATGGGYAWQQVERAKTDTPESQPKR